MGQRKQFTAGFKAKVAVEAIKGQRTAQEIGSIYGVHPTQVTTWKSSWWRKRRRSSRGNRLLALHPQAVLVYPPSSCAGITACG